jgi:hypothetical protein
VIQVSIATKSTALRCRKNSDGREGFQQSAKAKDADVLIMTASRFDQFPDIWVTNSTSGS